MEGSAHEIVKDKLKRTFSVKVIHLSKHALYMNNLIKLWSKTVAIDLLGSIQRYRSTNNIIALATLFVPNTMTFKNILVNNNKLKRNLKTLATL